MLWSIVSKAAQRSKSVGRETMPESTARRMPFAILRRVMVRYGIIRCYSKGGRRTEKDRWDCVQWRRKAAAREQSSLWFLTQKRGWHWTEVVQINWVNRRFLEERFYCSWYESWWESTRRQRVGNRPSINSRSSNVGRGFNEQEVSFDFKIVAFS